MVRTQADELVELEWWDEEECREAGFAVRGEVLDSVDAQQAASSLGPAPPKAKRRLAGPGGGPSPRGAMTIGAASATSSSMRSTGVTPRGKGGGAGHGPMSHMTKEEERKDHVEEAK